MKREGRKLRSRRRIAARFHTAKTQRRPKSKRPVAFRCLGSVTGNRLARPERLHRTVTPVARQPLKGLYVLLRAAAARAASQADESAEHRGMAPGVVLPAAWVSGLRSWRFNHGTEQHRTCGLRTHAKSPTRNSANENKTLRYGRFCSRGAPHQRWRSFSIPCVMQHKPARIISY